MITQKRRKRNEDLKLISIALIGALLGVATSFGILINMVTSYERSCEQDTAIESRQAVATEKEQQEYVTETEEIIMKESETEAESEAESETETETESETETEDASIKEFQDRCRLTYAEAGLQEQIGQIAVAAVVLNRQESEGFPNTFYGVMNYDSGFSSVRNKEIYIMDKNPYILEYEDVPQITIDATKRALEGEDPTEELLYEEAIRLGLDPEKYAKGGALYFYNPDATSDYELAKRAYVKCKIKIGSHIFYKIWDENPYL